MSAQVVSSIAQSLSELSLGSVETGLDKVRREFGASRASLALFGATGVEMLASVGRPLLANGVQVANDASSLFMSASHGVAFADEDLCRSPDFVRPVDQLMLASGFRSAWAVPVLRGRQVEGVLSLSHTSRQVMTGQMLGALHTLAALFSLPLGCRQLWLPARILVCNDSRLVAEGIARVLESALAADVVVACTEEELWVLDDDFDVVISDVVVFGISIASLAEECPAVRRSRLVVCSSYDTREQRAIANGAGAVAFLTQAEAGQIPAVVSAARSGLRPLTSADRGTAKRTFLPSLTPRESQVLISLEKGLTTRLIARGMGISDTTVKGYSRSLFAKLDVHSRAQAVHVAQQQGLLHRLRSRASAG